MAIRLKNITSSAIVLQMFKTDRPLVNFLEQNPILLLEPGEDIDTHYWLVTNTNDPSYNEDLVDSYIQKGILSKIVVSSAPNITIQPASVTVVAPNAISFYTGSSGSLPMTYQWKKNGSNVANGTGGTTNVYTTAATSWADNGALFTVTATNSLGSAVSIPAVLTVQTVPSFSLQPANTSVAAPATAQFTVTSDGHPSPTYQWKRSEAGDGVTYVDVVDGTGATTDTYTTAATSVIGDSGAFFKCVVTNAAGTITSTAGVLTVTA